MIFFSWHAAFLEWFWDPRTLDGYLKNLKERRAFANRRKHRMEQIMKIMDDPAKYNRRVALEALSIIQENDVILAELDRKIKKVENRIKSSA